jgi:hypothetical protein
LAKIGVGRETATVGEDLAQTGSGTVDEFGEKFLRRSIAVAQERE